MLDSLTKRVSTLSRDKKAAANNVTSASSASASTSYSTSSLPAGNHSTSSQQHRSLTGTQSSSGTMAFGSSSKGNRALFAVRESEPHQ